MARSGGLLGRLGGDRYPDGEAMRRLGQEFRRWALQTPEENRWGLPPDQIALVSFAAARIAPTVLRRAGMNPDDGERANVVAGYLLTVWANALVVLDADVIEKLRTGNPPTDRVPSEPIVTREGGPDDSPPS